MCCTMDDHGIINSDNGADKEGYCICPKGVVWIETYAIIVKYTLACVCITVSRIAENSKK